MAESNLPIGDSISLPATSGVQQLVYFVADRDYIILGAGMAANEPNQASGCIGILDGAGDMPGGPPTTFGTKPTTISSTNTNVLAQPIHFADVWIGNRYLSPPLVSLQAIYNESFDSLAAAIPVVSPPLVVRGSVFAIMAKSLSGTAVQINWAIRGRAIKAWARDLILNGQPLPRAVA